MYYYVLCVLARWMRYGIVRAVPTIGATAYIQRQAMFDAEWMCSTDNLSAVGTHHFISSNYTRTSHSHTQHMQFVAAIAILCIFNYLFVFFLVLLLRQKPKLLRGSIRVFIVNFTFHSVDHIELMRLLLASPFPNIVWCIQQNRNNRREICCKLRICIQQSTSSMCQSARLRYVYATRLFFCSISQRKLNWLHFNCIDCFLLCGSFC